MKRFLGILFAPLLVLSLVAIGLPSPVLAAPSEVWVDDDYCNGCPNDGHTWGYDAFDEIQDGIDAVASPGTVHVAAGDYNQNIVLEDGVEVLGAGADVATIYGGGSGSVVSGSDVGSTTKLDGFTITNGNASNGGGIYLYNSSPTISNCIFSGNLAGSGGGMYNEYYCSPRVTNCNFSGNSASSCGGGMYNYWYCSPRVTNCIFSDNSANGAAGMYNLRCCSPTVTNCIFSDNSATYHGGGMYNLNWSSPTVTNCNFSGNSASSCGGGMLSYNSSPAIINNIIVSNTASRGGGIYADDASYPIIDYNDVWNNTGGDYDGCSAGPNDISQDPLFVHPAADDYHLQPGSPCIDAGTNVGAPTEDIEGNPHPIDGDGDGTATTDMGAYEYVPPRPPPHFRYLHSEGSLIDLAAPIGTQWHELWPFFCKRYHLSSWNDTGGDGVLSRCDWIDMYEKPDRAVKCYHVEEVTITLFLTPAEPPVGDGVPPFESAPPGARKPMYIELEGGYNASVLTQPVCTQWHEIYPVFCRHYHLSSWYDYNMTDTLNPCDVIDLTDEAGEVTWWHVEDVATDIIVTREPPPVGGEAHPVNKASLLSPWIAVGLVLAGGTGWYVLRRRRTRS
jgi:hypothetical protein